MTVTLDGDNTPLLTQCLEHLRDTLGLELAVHTGGQAQAYPMIITADFELREGEAHGVRWLMAGLKENKAVTRPTIGQLVKRHQILRERWDGEVVLCLSRVTARARRMLIAERIPFIVPGTQVYLPFMGALLTERYPRSKPQRAAIRPVTQAVLLAHLYHRELSRDTLQAALGITRMSVSRAFQELADLDLTDLGLLVAKVGGVWGLMFTGERSEVWEGLQDRLQSPVLRRLPLLVQDSELLNTLPLAGDHAVAACTMLAANAPKVRAITKQQIDTITAEIEAGRLNETDEGDADVVVEVWSYQPIVHAIGQAKTAAHADPLSVALSLREQGQTDDRLAMALDEMVEAVW